MNEPLFRKIFIPLMVILVCVAVSLVCLWVNNPSQILAVLGGILFILGLPWYIKNPQWMLSITVIVIPLGVLAVVVPGMTAVPLLGAFLFVLCIPHLFLGTLQIPPLKRLYQYMALLAALIAMSAVLGINMGHSYIYWKSIYQMMGFAFLLICLMNTRDKLKILWWMIVLSCTLAALITLLAKYGLLPFSLSSFTYQNIGIDRQTGTDGDPNYFAVQLSVGFAFGLSAMLYLKKYWKWVLVFPLLLILLGGIGLTLSLGAIIGLFFLLIFHLITTDRLSIINKFFALIMILVMAVSVLAVPAVQRRLGEQVSEAKYGIWRLGSDRVLTWSAGTNLVLHYPFKGVGIGNHGLLLPQYDIFNVRNKDDKTFVQVAHNMYISFAADNGIPTLIVFLCIIGFVFRRLRKINRLNLPDKFIINSVLSSLFCYLIQNIFLDGWRGKYLWVLIGMGAAIIILYPQKSDEGSNIENLRQPADT